MNQEDLERYALIGIRADVQAKANALHHEVVLMAEALAQGSGTYVRSRYRTRIDSLVAAAVAFDEALVKKEGGTA